MENPETDTNTTQADICERTGVKPDRLSDWINAARTAINLEEASKEIKEKAKTFFIKFRKFLEKPEQQFIFPTGKELGLVKLKELRLVAKSPEEIKEKTKAFFIKLTKYVEKFGKFIYFFTLFIKLVLDVRNLIACLKTINSGIF